MDLRSQTEANTDAQSKIYIENEKLHFQDTHTRTHGSRWGERQKFVWFPLLKRHKWNDGHLTASIMDLLSADRIEDQVKEVCRKDNNNIKMLCSITHFSSCPSSLHFVVPFSLSFHCFNSIQCFWFGRRFASPLFLFAELKEEWREKK